MLQTGVGSFYAHGKQHDAQEFICYLMDLLNVQLPCKYVRNAHSENPRESAYKRGGTGVVQIQKFSRFGQREDGQCLSRYTTRLYGSRCPYKPAKTGPSTSINTQANKNGRVSGARANSRSSGSL